MFVCWQPKISFKILNFKVQPSEVKPFLIAKYLLERNLDFILIDEAQFLKEEQVEQLSDIVDILGINVICYGLRTDFRGELFPGSKRLFEMADPIESITRQCS